MRILTTRQPGDIIIVPGQFGQQTPANPQIDSSDALLDTEFAPWCVRSQLHA